MHYLLISFSHKNADLSVREKLAFSPEAKEYYLGRIAAHPSVNEVMILSTCNRVEIFASVKALRDSVHFLFGLLAEHSGIDPVELEGRADLFEDQGAIHHLFSVISSLDSLVIGETQITGQVKDAYNFAYERGFVTQKIVRAMHYALRCASTVRNSTQIAKNPVSVASAAVAMAADLCGTLSGKTALVVGAGEMGELAARHLLTHGAKVIIVNRNQERVEKLINIGLGVEYRPFEELSALLNRLPILFMATSSREPVIRQEMVRSCDFERFWFDLSVPRNIEEVKSDGLRLYAVDHLQEIVSKNMALREEQARIAYGIVGQFTIDFYRWLETLSVDPIIKALRSKAELAIEKELSRALAKKYLPVEMEEQVRRMMSAAFNAFLHTPTVKLKELAANPESDDLIESFRQAFELDAERIIVCVRDEQNKAIDTTEEEEDL